MNSNLLWEMPPLFLSLMVAGGALINRRAERIKIKRALLTGAEQIPESTGTKYRSRVGPVYLVAFVLFCAALVWIGHRVLDATEAAAAHSAGEAGNATAALLFFMKLTCRSLLVVAWVAPFCLALFAALGINYVITDHELEITVGCVRKMMRDIEMRPPFYAELDRSIPLSGILEIRRTYNPVSAPALSFHRLLIRYKNERGKEASIVISPEDGVKFVAYLAARTPGLEIIGPCRAVKRPYTGA